MHSKHCRLLYVQRQSFGHILHTPPVQQMMFHINNYKHLFVLHQSFFNRLLVLYVSEISTLAALSPFHSSFQVHMKAVKPSEIFQKILKNGSTKQGRLLGLDVGYRYVGLAVSDTHNKVASPVSVLVRKKTNIESMAEDFQTLISRLSLVGFVVGFPFSLHGQHNLEAVQVRLFMEELRKTGKLDGLCYTYWDENYTSKCVEALLHPLNLHPVEHKTIMDKFAAVGILQGYLDHMNRNLKSEGRPKELSNVK